ncbi:hypothetical protein EV684_104161 [Rubrivivax gelatinosus]|uniref:Uncharacterized protein n=1 Tax=Rubrivivax gelatinosus TaxID=28068 RepID=A0A4R2MAF4_RUBGE|nr:hypothetical protein EV684_104161 [Rubrivivax gelatinosus]
MVAPRPAKSDVRAGTQPAGSPSHSPSHSRPAQALPVQPPPMALPPAGPVLRRFRRGRWTLTPA